MFRLTCNPVLQSRIPNYTTRFGFGLHAGWGIEGAIGSALKIDPTYLSPNVKWSERLETATKVTARAHASLCARIERGESDLGPSAWGLGFEGTSAGGGGGGRRVADGHDIS